MFLHFAFLDPSCSSPGAAHPSPNTQHPNNNKRLYSLLCIGISYITGDATRNNVAMSVPFRRRSPWTRRPRRMQPSRRRTPRWCTARGCAGGECRCENGEPNGVSVADDSLSATETDVGMCKMQMDLDKCAHDTTMCDNDVNKRVILYYYKFEE